MDVLKTVAERQGNQGLKGRRFPELSADLRGREIKAQRAADSPNYPWIYEKKNGESLLLTIFFRVNTLPIRRRRIGKPVKKQKPT